MKLSVFGQRFSQDAGILELMDDLGRALEQPGSFAMLGGGNPASIPEVNQRWRESLNRILSTEGELEAVLAQYDSPSGRLEFRRTLAGFFQRNFGWDVGSEHIVVTGGSQSAFFLLFNMLSGPYPQGPDRQILFPLAPEYIGYADQGLQPSQFLSRRPLVTEEAEPYFKYHVDFSNLTLDSAVGALCASRPTNPTGNVLSDDEVRQLASLAKEARIPFLLDNAYGAPFPSILFEPIAPYWDDNTVLSLSLSKLGLPSARNGILVAPEPIARAVGQANAVLNLTNAGLGQALVSPLLADDSILSLCRLVIQPYYLARRDAALALADEIFARRFAWRVHRPQGSLFLWFWFPRLPITSRELYRRLKERQVLIVPGEAFFFGLPDSDQEWQHRFQCVRVHYAREPLELERGLRVLANIVEEASLD